MSHALSGSLKKTPLNARHGSLGVRMVEFGGWDMPVEYSGIADEHMAVRTRAGLFDVSHMGEIEVAGRDALKAVQHITTNDASRLSIGQAQYSALPTPEGTFVDDVLTYRFAEDHFLLVVNASNIMKDFNWIAAQIGGMWDAVAVTTSGPSTVKKDHLVGGASRLAALLLPHILPVFSVVAPCQPGAALRDLVLFHRGRATSSRYALVALQGPAAREVLQTLTGITLGDIKYWFTTGEVAGVRGTVSRTGYTGEDGFEVFVPPASAERVWDAILQAGKVAGVLPRASARAIRCASRRPCVFTATTSTKSRRSWKRTSGGSSAGRKTISSAAAVLRKQKQEGVARRLVGFEMLDRAIGRHGYDVYMNGAKAGVVTSGTQTP
jgi:glycine cleavage system T protein (aminomethyltransferase)